MAFKGKRVTPEVRAFVETVKDNVPVPGVDINPQRMEGESDRAFKRRMFHMRQKAFGGGPTEHTSESKAAAYQQAYQWFMDGLPEGAEEGVKLPANPEPTVTEVGMRLKLHLPTLLQWSIDRNWEMMRANKKAGQLLAGGEARLQLAARVDRITLAKIEVITALASEAYENLLRKAAALPDDHTELTEADDPGQTPIAGDVAGMEGAESVLTEDAGPRNRTGPKRGRNTLLKQKASLINDITKGFFGMLDGVRNHGLLVPVHTPKKSDGDPQNGVDMGKLASLNNVFIQIQSGQKPTEAKNVTDV
jgi:hypothetical protein